MLKGKSSASVQMHCSLSLVHSDPNKGDLKVPVTWPEFTSSGQKFIEIHSDMDRNYVGEMLRLRYVQFWTSILPNLSFLE